MKKIPHDQTVLAQGKQGVSAYLSVGYEPNALLGTLMATLRRRRMAETADQRLDRLIELERQTRSQRSQGEEARPEMRRLVVEEGPQPGGNGPALEDRALRPGEPTRDPVEDLVPLFAELTLGSEASGRAVHRRDDGRDGVPEGVRQLEAGVSGSADQGREIRMNDEGSQSLVLGNGRNLVSSGREAVVQLGEQGRGWEQGLYRDPGLLEEAPRSQHGVQGQRLEQGLYRDPGLLRGDPRSQHGEGGQRSDQGLHRVSEPREGVSVAMHVGEGWHDLGRAGQPAAGQDTWPRNTLAWGIASELAEVGRGLPANIVPTMGAAGPGIEIMNPEYREDERRGDFVEASRLDVAAAGNTAQAQEIRIPHELEETRRAGFSHGDRELELIRQRVLRDAEAAYLAEVRRLRGEDGGSYHTASSGEQGRGHELTRPMSLEERGELQAGAEVQPITSPGVGIGRNLFSTMGSGGPVQGNGSQAGGSMTTPIPRRSPGQGATTPQAGGAVQGPGHPMSMPCATGLGAPDPPPGLQGIGGCGATDSRHQNVQRGVERTPDQGLQQGVNRGLHPGRSGEDRFYGPGHRLQGAEGAQHWSGQDRPPQVHQLYGEPVKGSDLPALPALGSDQSPLLFGDWLTLVKPAMYDLATQSKEWWDQTIEEVETLYGVWLQASPLQRLRLRPAEGAVPARLQRIEMKGVNMLLQILPEGIKRDIVSGRTLSSTVILFKLFTLFQPGGGSEKAGLLKQIVEPKVPTSAGDLLTSLRQWRRWLSRAGELQLALPDSSILATVLSRFADALSKAGGGQMGFRISTARQELGVDHRPTATAVLELAEYLQAESEELTLMIGVKNTPPAHPPAPNPVPASPAVKAMNYGGHGQDSGEQEKQKSYKAPCRFWKSEEGCRKGIECTYLHDAVDMKGRCFGCGSTSHVKKECPVGRKPQEGATKQEKVKKMQKPKTEKSGKQERGENPTSSSSTATTRDGTSKGEERKPDRKDPAATTVDQPEVTQGTPVTNSVADELLKEAAGLLKSLKGQQLKAVRIKSVGEGNYGEPGEFALLDGGATNALRKARSDELQRLYPTVVELAHGTTTLYRVQEHQTLLSKTDVEPIIPLSWLVQSGYKIDWSRDRCVIQHPKRGPLPCELRAGCPVMKRSQGLELLDDLEKGRAGSQVQCDEFASRWWQTEFPDLPQRLLRWTEGQDRPWKTLGSLPWNRHKRRRMWKSRGVVLHLFAGADHRPWEAWQQQGYEVLCMDIKKGGDLHNPAVWAFLWELASSNRLVGVIGGPPCRSVSRLRMRQPGPVPLRGRDLEDRWGLPGLSVTDQQKTDYDSMLMLKQIALWKRAEEVRVTRIPTMFLMESPEDPMNYLPEEEAQFLPSFWMFPEVLALMDQPNFKITSFDQGAMGHSRCKPTSLLSNLPMIRQLEGVRVQRQSQDPLPQSVVETIRMSEGWSKWAPGLIAAIIKAGEVYLNLAAENYACRRLDVEGFKRHIQNNHVPYRRDCKQCVETMGQSEPHRRLKLDGAAYCLSLDLAGPYPLGKDEGFNKKSTAKYILVGTVSVPRSDREGSDVKEADDESKLKDSPEDVNPGELCEEHREEDMATEDEVAALNESWKEKAKELSTTVGLQQVTMVEVLDSRHTKDVVPGTGRIYAKMKAYGIPIHRIHTDRERCFITTGFRDFCLNRSLFQTMTSGDTPQENGRVESEINQVKRRLRLMLAESQLPRANWPNVVRWVGEQRCRAQLQQLGVPTKPMIAPGTKVMVKQKLWNKKGGALSNPYKRMTLLGPSPLMSSGWVVKDGNKVQHAKVVVIESPESEAARLELHEARPRRLQGKQSGDPDQPRLAPPKVSAKDPLPELQDPLPELQDEPIVAVPLDAAAGLHDDFVYSPESPLPHDEADRPALHAMQAGGESERCSERCVPALGEYQQCSGCGLMQPGGQCGFCFAPCSSSSRSGLAALSSSMSSRSGLATSSSSTSSRSGLATSSSSMSSRSGLSAGSEEAEDWSVCANPVLLMDQIRDEHWRWKQQWSQELTKTVVGAEEAAIHGDHLGYLEEIVLDLEEELSSHEESCRGVRRLKAMTSGQGESPASAHPVLQTYTVGLADVRNNMAEWEGAIRKELTSLFETTKALRRTTVKELSDLPGVSEMEQAPMKLVATVKAPDGRKKARLVLCGNLIQSSTGDQVAAAKDPLGCPLYAGGLDGVALRTVLRKAAAEGWSIAGTDVSTAFLLAPRQSNRLLVVRPPQLLVDHQLATKEERWVVDHAVYGLETSPKDWGSFRDSEMARMTWTSDGFRYRFLMSTEPNLWKILQAPIGEDGKVDDDSETSMGLLVTYVDDMLALGPRGVVSGALSCVRAKWKCSPEEWVTDSSWMKFCGMELRWKDDQLLVGQPSYTRELVHRHGSQPLKSTPAPKVDPEIVEDEKTAEEIKQAQQVVGELLWLSVRTRPDISYIVSWMGRHVAKAPKAVCQVSDHVIGYLQGTLDYALAYGKCPSEGEGSLLEITALSDASHAPGGGRGCQGILVTWGDAAVQWEAKAQPFAALSSTEAELIGYVDAMTMGESLGAIIAAIEGERMPEGGVYKLKGDNLSGLQLLVAPDGPWRTRHLRLRSYVLRERIASGDWLAEHVPGAKLSVDLLTKPIVVTSSWVEFRRSIGLIEIPEEIQPSAKVEKLSGCLEGLVTLSRVFASSGVSSVARMASAVGLSTLVACLHHESLNERGTRTKSSKQDLKRARCTGKAGDTIGPTTASPGLEAPGMQGEVEKRKVLERPPKDLSKGLRENKPTQTSGHAMKALRMSGPLGRSASIAIAEAMEMEPPFDFWPLTEEVYKRAPTSGKDQWVRLGRGWWCKQHKEWRITSFNPIHRNVPFAVESLVPERFTLCYWRDAQGRWLRQCHQDGWMQPPKKYLENEPTALSLQWIGYTFFKVDESLVNQGDVQQPQVIRSDHVDWRETAGGSDESARGSNMPPPDRISGGAKARGRAALPMTLRGSIRKSFPGGILPSQQQEVLRHRPGQGEGCGRADENPPEVRGPGPIAPSSGAYQPMATPYYAGGPTEIPYRFNRGEGFHGERAESETATSDVVTEMVVHEEPAGDEDPTDGDPYSYMLTHVVDTVEDMMWQSGASLPLPSDPMPVGDGPARGAAFQNGRHPHVAALRPLMGQAFQSGMMIPKAPTEDAYEDTMSDPGEAIARLLEPAGPAYVKGGGKGRGLRQRRVPAGHPEWAPPVDGGREVEIIDDCPETESDEEDDGFRLIS